MLLVAVIHQRMDLACLNFLKKLIEGGNGQSKYKGLEINGLAQHLIAMYVVHISVLIVLMKVTSLNTQYALSGHL